MVCLNFDYICRIGLDRAMREGRIIEVVSNCVTVLVVVGVMVGFVGEWVLYAV